MSDEVVELERYRVDPDLATRSHTTGTETRMAPSDDCSERPQEGVGQGFEEEAATAPVFVLEEALDAIPQDVRVWPEVEMDSDDPAYVDSLGRRQCIATKKAGGRCTVGAMHVALTCAVHSGVLDPQVGGLARAAKRRDAREVTEEQMRLARLGARGVIAQILNEEHLNLAGTVRTLLRAAAAGDTQAAKAVVPYLNQGFGMPTETVSLSAPQTSDEIASMSTADLVALVAQSG